MNSGQWRRRGFFSLPALAPAAPSTRKPFATFAQFYPFYLSQHAKPTTKLLHVVGTCAATAAFVRTPRLGLALIAGASVGGALVPLLRRFDSGALEMAAMVGTYVALGAKLTGSLSATLAPLVVAYTMAWVGHFIVEKNRPATFIYPTFSLIGDFVMCGEALLGRHVLFGKQ